MQQIEKVDNVNMVEKAFRRFIFKGFHMTLFRRLQLAEGSGRPNMSWSWCWESPIRCHPNCPQLGAHRSTRAPAHSPQLTAHTAR